VSLPKYAWRPWGTLPNHVGYPKVSLPKHAWLPWGTLPNHAAYSKVSLTKHAVVSTHIICMLGSPGPHGRRVIFLNYKPKYSILSPLMLEVNTPLILKVNINTWYDDTIHDMMSMMSMMIWWVWWVWYNTWYDDIKVNIDTPLIHWYWRSIHHWC
jgi:hypothetical protein